MRFICTEVNPNTNDLYRKDPTDKSVIVENNYKYTKSNKISTKDGLIYSYCNDTIREIIFSQHLPDGIEYTLTEWLTHVGLTGTDHTGITTDFVFNNYTSSEILSSYFFTIIAEDGIHFTLPQRLTTSKEIRMTNNDVVSEFYNYETDYSFQGETGMTFLVGESGHDTVRPYAIDSTMKSHRINKYKSKLNMITIQTGIDCVPLDYVFWKGKYYIAISKSEIKSGLYAITFVREEKESNVIAGSDISQYEDSKYKQILIVNETQATGVNAGGFTSGADRTRVLNTTIINTINGASLASNQITLPIGKYRITASAPAYIVGVHQTMLYNVGLTTKPLIGTSEYNEITTAAQTRSYVIGYFEITSVASSNNVLEIRHQCSTTRATNGLGVASNLGNVEIYTTVEIEKIG